MGIGIIRSPQDRNNQVIFSRLLTTEGQRQRLAEVLRIPDSQSTTPLAQDLEWPPAKRAETTVSRIVRDTSHSRRVKAQHHYECQLCGHALPLTEGKRY